MPRIVAPRKFIDAADHQVGQDRPRKMKSTGPAKDALEPKLVEPVERINQSKLDQLALNEEFINVVLHDTTDKQANSLPDLEINGKRQFFIRGKTQAVRWKYVELLARCKETTFTQDKYQDANGTEGYKQIPHTATKYTFSLVDAPQKFQDRLKVILAERG